MFRDKALLTHPPIFTVTIEIMYNTKTHADLITVKDSGHKNVTVSVGKWIFLAKCLTQKLKYNDINFLG